MAMIDFTKPMPDKRKYLRQVTDWVEDILDHVPADTEDVTVLVNELQCFEPDCAPLETVITLLGRQSIILKIFKPVAEVQLPEVQSTLEAHFAGHAAPLTLAEQQRQFAQFGAQNSFALECGVAMDE